MTKVKPRSAKDMAMDNMIVKMYAGSIAYGTNLPTSDVDYRGLFHADPVNILTPFFTVTEFEDKSEEDTKYYEVSKFINLYLDANPNIIELLWTDDKHIVERSPLYDMLREHRLALLSSKVRFSFSGYAVSQLKRIKGHNKFINKPKPVDPPRQTSFVTMVQNFTDKKILPREFSIENYRSGRLIPFGGELYGLYPKDHHPAAKGYQTYSDDFTLNTVFDNESRADWGAPALLVKFNKEEYLREKDDWKNYWTWKKNRNEKRSELEEQFGYDTKHAMHLVRLLRMGQEILEHGEVRVYRPDAQELLDIRNGAWTYEELLEFAEEMDNSVLPNLYKTTALPKKPDVKLAASVLMDVYDAGWLRK